MLAYVCGFTGNVIITLGFITGAIWIFKEEILGIK